MPAPVLINDGDASDAFFDQFSSIIRLEARLNGDNSEGVTGPAHQRWAVRHLAEVAEAQGFTVRPATQGTPFNVHAQEFITPPSAQTATFNHSGYTTPWYENFNLADQGIPDSSGHYRPPAENQRFARPPNAYRPFDLAEQAEYRAAVQTRLFPHGTHGTQRVFSAPQRPYRAYNDMDQQIYITRAAPYFQLPSTRPAANRYSSTPLNQPAGYHGRTPSLESLPSIVTNTTLHANTEPIAQSARMSALAAPDHYEPIEIHALEVRNGDFIQSVKNPGT